MNKKKNPKVSILWKVKEEGTQENGILNGGSFCKGLHVENSVVQLNTTGIQTVKVMDIEPLHTGSYKVRFRRQRCIAWLTYQVMNE